jgi:outer membrane protein TolC
MDLAASLAEATQRRPEIALLQIESRQVRLDRNLAENQLLPTFDVMADALQDVGTPTSRSDDKGEFELIFGLQGELPIQRRKALGKIQSTSAKMAQINQKLRLQRDKIGIELQTAFNALQIAAEVVRQAEIALLASFETLEIYRFAFTRGKTDLIYLNFLESKANEAEIKVIDAQRNWFMALAELQIALGLDPLEQALNVEALPPSNRLGPGNLPPPLNTLPDDFDADWEKRQGNQNN